MAADAFDLHRVEINGQSPGDIADWPITLAITHVSCTPGGGFVIETDPDIPARWDFMSNPGTPDHYRYTVWACVNQGGQWRGSGFVQMWEGRDRALPAFFAPNDGTQPGYVSWWADPRHMWGAMSDYVPAAGDQVGFLLSAGNARGDRGVSSVRERSNLVLVTLNAGDLLDSSFSTGTIPTPEPQPTDPGPQPPDPSTPATNDTARILDAISASQQAIDAHIDRVKNDLAKALSSAIGILIARK